MNKHLTTGITTAAALLATSGLVGYGAQANAQDGGQQHRPSGAGCHLSVQEVANWSETSARLAQACDQDAYTVLDHPSLPCQLTAADVANWGETSAHLPLACTYSE